MAAPFGDPYKVRVSGDFLPKLCVVTSARMSVCKLRLQFVERGVVEGKLMDSRCRTFYCPLQESAAWREHGRSLGFRELTAFSQPGAGIHFTFKAAEVHIAREVAVTD